MLTHTCAHTHTQTSSLQRHNGQQAQTRGGVLPYLPNPDPDARTWLMSSYRPGFDILLLSVGKGVLLLLVETQTSEVEEIR